VRLVVHAVRHLPLPGSLAAQEACGVSPNRGSAINFSSICPHCGGPMRILPVVPVMPILPVMLLRDEALSPLRPAERLTQRTEEAAIPATTPTAMPTGLPAALPAACCHGADSELVLQALAGSKTAFETIVRRYNRLLFRTARGVVGDDAEAQDVVQETYLRAFTRMQTFRGDSALGTWLARIAINLALSSQRKKGRAIDLGPTDRDADEQPEENAMTASTSDDQAPDALAQRSQVRHLLQDSIEALPAIYRTVFILRAVEELSVQETAFCLAVSEDVVKTRFLRARAMLRETLAARVEPRVQDTFSFAGSRCDAICARVLSDCERLGLLQSP
jgi:RNA polymerase sigma factor (sigma-70 family)